MLVYSTLVYSTLVEELFVEIYVVMLIRFKFQIGGGSDMSIQICEGEIVPFLYIIT